jgi:hypothetical protein
MATDTRERAIDAVDLLNDLVVDLSSAVALWRSMLDARASGIANFDPGVLQRLCLGQICIGLYKLHEVLGTYSATFGARLVEERRSMRREIELRGALALRNECIGHIHTRADGRPLRASEVDAKIATLTNNDLERFLAWLCDDKESIHRTLLDLRDGLMTDFAIEPREIMER